MWLRGLESLLSFAVESLLGGGEKDWLGRFSIAAAMAEEEVVRSSAEMLERAELGRELCLLPARLPPRDVGWGDMMTCSGEES